MKKEKLEKKVYFLDNVSNSTEVEEYIASYICKKGAKKGSNVERKNDGRWGKKVMNIDLGKIRFAVYPVKENNGKEEVIVLKTSKDVKYENRMNQKEKFKSSLCFILRYSCKSRFNFIFEELIEDVMRKTDMYVNL